MYVSICYSFANLCIMSNIIFIIIFAIILNFTVLRVIIFVYDCAVSMKIQIYKKVTGYFFQR